MKTRDDVKRPRTVSCNRTIVMKSIDTNLELTGSRKLDQAASLVVGLQPEYSYQKAAGQIQMAVGQYEN